VRHEQLRLVGLVAFTVRAPYRSDVIGDHEVGMVSVREDVRAVVERS
jgi:hypothetical protein